MDEPVADEQHELGFAAGGTTAGALPQGPGMLGSRPRSRCRLDRIRLYYNEGRVAELLDLVLLDEDNPF
jgi:hypothetical protein